MAFFQHRCFLWRTEGKNNSW